MPSVGQPRERTKEVDKKMERKTRTVLAGTLGVVGAGLVLAVAVKALPTLLRGVMSRVMPDTTSPTGEGRLRPPSF